MLVGSGGLGLDGWRCSPGAGHYAHCHDPDRFAGLSWEFDQSSEPAQVSTFDLARRLAGPPVS